MPGSLLSVWCMLLYSVLRILYDLVPLFTSPILLIKKLRQRGRCLCPRSQYLWVVRLRFEQWQSRSKAYVLSHHTRLPFTTLWSNWCISLHVSLVKWWSQDFIRAQMVKNPSAVRRPGVDPLVRKIPWRRAWQPTPVFLPREPPWTEKPGRLQSMGLQTVGHGWVTNHTIWFRVSALS